MANALLGPRWTPCDLYLAVRVGGVGVGGGGGAAGAAPCEEAGVAGGQGEAVRLDHAAELSRALGGNGNLLEKFLLHECPTIFLNL